MSKTTLPASISANERASKLAFEVALGYHSPADLQQLFSLTEEGYALLNRSPDFRKAVLTYRREIDETGADFRIKARKLSFNILSDLEQIVRDPTSETKDRVAAARLISELAGYGQKEAAQAPATAAQFNLQIVMPPAGQAATNQAGAPCKIVN